MYGEFFDIGTKENSQMKFKLSGQYFCVSLKFRLRSKFSTKSAAFAK